MTIFVVSLFLPHTVSFDVEKTAPSQDTTPAQQQDAERRARALTTIATVASIIPKTPGATTNLEEIFVPGDGGLTSLKLRLPASRSVTHLSALAHRPDGHSPGWGMNLSRNQPASRARDLPPESILQRDTMNIRNIEIMLKGRARGITVSAEHRFRDDNYTVVPSTIGNGGLVVALDAATDAGLLTDKTWVGSLGMPTNALSDKVKTSIEEKLALEYESLTVWIDDNDLNGHYEHYCKTILWPHLHYQVPDHPKSKAYADHSWGFYLKVNQAFADKIVKNWKRGDMIWIHDYHLMLVPRMIRERLLDAEIGFFMHTAFPSSEIFRCLASRTSLIEGLLGANMVGFQTDEYMHHFLQTCSRLLNVEATKDGVILDDGRFVHANHFPIGVDIDILETRRQESDVAKWIETISHRYKGKKLVIARDKLDSTRGVIQKLLAYEKFLENYPEYHEQVVLIQIATSAQENSDINRDVSNVVRRINTAHSSLTHQPLVLLRQDIDYSQWLALIMQAECLLITSLREGMNLTGHEFVYCQDGTMSPTKHSPIIVSEFTGAAAVFRKDAILTNPWDISQCAKAMKQALSMTTSERERRWRGLHDTVVRYCATNWYKKYIKALEHAYKEHSIRDATSVPRLNNSTLKKQYMNASKRLLILDLEGTLAVWGSPGDTVAPTPKRALDILTDLTEDDKNIVYVMSGRGPAELEALFDRVPRLGLIAENGAYLREARGSEWDNACDMEQIKSWKGGVRSILEYYQERLKGSRIEEFNTSLVFKYDQAEDAEMAFTQSSECANHISDVCFRQGVHAVPIDHGLCVSNIDINKCSATELISKRLRAQAGEAGQMPEFLLVIGDSREDEYVYDWAIKMKEQGVREVITVTAGSRNTTASAAVTQGVVGVLSALQKLVMTAQSP